MRMKDINDTAYKVRLLYTRNRISLLMEKAKENLFKCSDELIRLLDEAIESLNEGDEKGASRAIDLASKELDNMDENELVHEVKDGEFVLPGHSVTCKKEEK